MDTAADVVVANDLFSYADDDDATASQRSNAVAVATTW